MQMTAAKGIFQTKGEILKLEDQIFLKSSTYEGRLQEAVVEMKKGTVSSDKPVDAEMARRRSRRAVAAHHRQRRHHSLRWRCVDDGEASKARRRRCRIHRSRRRNDRSCHRLCVEAASGSVRPRACVSCDGRRWRSRACRVCPTPCRDSRRTATSPCRFRAGSLEVRGKDKTAVWTGEVKVVQGDTTMRAKTLTVFYDGDQAKVIRALTRAARRLSLRYRRCVRRRRVRAATQSIRRLEAKGSVIVTQKDQTVTGESAVFDMTSNTVTMGGGVRADPGSECPERRAADGQSDDRHLEGRESSQGGRVTGMFQAGSDRRQGDFVPARGSSPPAADATPPDRSQPGKPLRLNGFPLNSRPAG